MKAVLITGSSSGIGYHTALYLDKQSLHVFVRVREQADTDRLQVESSERLTPIMIVAMPREC